GHPRCRRGPVPGLDPERRRAVPLLPRAAIQWLGGLERLRPPDHPAAGVADLARALGLLGAPDDDGDRRAQPVAPRPRAAAVARTVLAAAPLLGSLTRVAVVLGDRLSVHLEHPALRGGAVGRLSLADLRHGHPPALPAGHRGRMARAGA